MLQEKLRTKQVLAVRPERGDGIGQKGTESIGAIRHAQGELRLRILVGCLHHNHPFGQKMGKTLAQRSPAVKDTPSLVGFAQWVIGGMMGGVVTKKSGGEIVYLNGERLRQAVISGAHRVIANKDYLNLINVFPVPDSDTGSNLAATMRAVLHALQGSPLTYSAVSETIASSALAGARGNSGVIMAQFLQGLHEATSDQLGVSVAKFVAATKRAATRAREALAVPQEGTILTVIGDFVEHVAHQAGRLGDFITLMEEGVQAARRSLAETTNQLAVLRKAGVVDAGALGFVNFLEGILDYFKCGTAAEKGVQQVVKPSATAVRDLPAQRVDFRYCTEAIIVGDRIDHPAVKRRLAAFGDSIVVAGTKQEAHVHVHSNVPAYALEVLAELGEIRHHNVEDMLAQIEEVPGEADRSGIAVVTDSVCDLPISFLTAERVHVVPVQVAFGEEAYLDRVQITPKQFYNKLDRCPMHPKTSQPSPAEFLRVYRHLATHCTGILSIHLSSKVSGTYQVALGAARSVSDETGVPIEVVDSGSASGAQGLVVWAAARAAAAGLSLSACRRLGEDAAAGASIVVFVPTVEYFVRGGRLSPIQGRIAEWLQLKPILTVREGTIAVAGKTIGRRRAMRKTLCLATERAKTMGSPAFILAHSDAVGLAHSYAESLRRRFSNALIMVTDATPALGAHAGPGGIAIAVLDAAPIDRMIAQGKTED